ncbi:hypothetical protein RD110_07870 [Rhodoferax koreense]|uniref:Uncharacterized protein n=1 Tax=Rhodoferax koreensis TaxID=1842727 RepID=A0A1P8JTN1_9BURK|nr:hypothetical protein [Rhodoferax koreense]APW37120.1 hypothetical protein RD110_07870 [Rhodoferax koreense]
MNAFTDIAKKRGLNIAKERTLDQIAAAIEVAALAFPGSEYTRNEILAIAQIIAINHIAIPGVAEGAQ